MVGIITFHCQHNYGSALQAYAMQEAVRKSGQSCKILNFYYEKDMKQYDIRWQSKRLDVIAFDLLTLKKSIMRKKAYHKFQNKFFELTKKTSDWHELKKISEAFEILICGSDQIWNISLFNGLHPAYFLKFANDKQKLISYAPSVAIESIQDNYFEDFRENLKRFTAISVREEQTASQLHEITGKDVKCVLDPTLLFGSDFYDEMIKGYALKLPKKYIFLYCLHHADLNILRKYAELLADKYGLDIVYFNKYNIYNKHYKCNIFEYDPRAFVCAIKNAEYVISDSFHAGVFAIIYRKNFKTFALKDSKSRMNTLFKHLNIENRFINKIEEMPEQINYDDVYKKLDKLRKVSLEYLANAIGIQDYE